MAEVAGFRSKLKVFLESYEQLSSVEKEETLSREFAVRCTTAICIITSAIFG